MIDTANLAQLFGLPSITVEVDAAGVLLTSRPALLPHQAAFLREHATVAGGTLRERLAQYLPFRRWWAETGGIEIAGTVVATDRQSQQMISGALAYLSRNPTASIRWKTPDGWTTVGLAQIGAIADAVGAHVQACFAREAELAGQLANAADDDLAALAAVVDQFFPHP